MMSENLPDKLYFIYKNYRVGKNFKVFERSLRLQLFDLKIQKNQ